MPEGQGVQQEFAFIPDDGSATYVVNVERNSTKVLTGQYLIFNPSYLVCLLLRPPLLSITHIARRLPFGVHPLTLFFTSRSPTKRPLRVLHRLTHHPRHARFQRPGGISRV